MSLDEVAPSAAAALEVPGFTDSIGFGQVRHSVVLLIDGLGAQLLREHAEDAPIMAGTESAVMDTVFPSTTPVALGSLGTGMLAGAHGFVGGSFWLPEADVVLNPLQWPAGVSPMATQPERTVYERARAAGVEVTSIADAKYEHSGLTQAALRGTRYVASDLPGDGARRLAEATTSADRTLTYAYWAPLDRIGHEFGAGSREWRLALRQADAIVGALADALPAHAAMVVTADHGMVNCPPEVRIDIEDDQDLIAGVIRIAGEPRVRHLYCAGEAESVAHRWTARLGDRVRVLTREALIDTGLLGPVEPDIADRIGDVVVIAQHDTSLASRGDRRVSSLLGQHGALTAVEREIPLLWFRTD